MLESIKNNIELIKLWFYILQILIIAIWIYVWIKNYKELIRKNNIEEYPYLRINIFWKDSENILFKNYGKTPVKIVKISIYESLNEKEKSFTIINKVFPTEIMPNEEIIVNYKELNKYIKYWEIESGSYIMKICYENHIETKTKLMNIVIPEINKIGVFSS